MPEGTDESAALRVRPTPFVRHPLVPVSICLISGILLHETVPPAPWLGVLFAACYAVAAMLARSSLISSGCLAIALVGLGFAAAQAAHYRFAGNHIAHYATEQPRLAEVEFRLKASPRLLRVADIGRPRPPKMTAVVEIVAVTTWAGRTPASGTALLQLYRPDPRLSAGQRVRAFGKLQRPGPAVNPGQFDFENYYRGQRTLVSLSVDEPANLEVLETGPPGWIVCARQAARELLVAGFGPRETESAALLKAMLLGERDPAMSDARELFRASGTSHYLAVSGLHVGIVAGGAFLVLKGFGTGPKVTVLGGILTVLAYSLLAAPAPPVWRAAILALALGGGLLFGRRAAGVQLLSAAALLLLLVAPLDLYRAGFQLSFVTVLGLMVFGEAVRRRLQQAGAGDATDSDLLRRQNVPLVRAGQWLDARMLKGLAAAVVAWLAAMPLVALHFGQFNSWAIPASLAAAPSVTLALLGGVLKILATAVLPEYAEVWAMLAGAPVEWMRATVAFFAAMPGADVPLPVPTLAAVTFFYAAMLLAWAAVPREGHWFPTPALVWAARAPVAVAALIVFVLPLIGADKPMAKGPLRVTLLAVGAGQCAVIETPAGEATLIDAGSSSLSQPLEQCVGPFLRHRGYADVARLVLSHANFDHYNAAAEVVAQYDVAEVLVAGSFADDAAEQVTGRQLLNDLSRGDRPPRTVRPGDVLPLGRETQLRILWPPPDRNDLEPNDASLVVKLEHNDRSILFTGDIQEAAMRELLALDAASPGLLKADVLIAPHHGSSERSTTAFVEAVNPDYVLSSNARRLSQKQRDLEIMMGGRPLLRTHETGAITIELDAAGTVTLSTFLNGGRATLTYPE